MMRSETAGRSRNYQLDNVRAILIYLVVLGHLIPTYEDGSRGYLFNFIYSFHMAVFVFTSGYYAHFDRKKIIKHYLWPYFIFQTIYYFFNLYVLETDAKFQFTRPRYTLWYLLTLATYQCMLPLLRVRNRKQAATIFSVSLAASVMVGLDDSIGTYLSLSRTITFLPFFLLGLYRNYFINEKTKPVWNDNRLLAAAAAAIAGLELIVLFSDFHPSILKFDNEYTEISSLPIRLTAVGLGMLWIFVLFRLVPGKRIRILTTVGQNTMPVYLLHGFIARSAGHFHVLCFEPVVNDLIAAGIAAVIVLLFGNGFLGKPLKAFLGKKE